MNLITIENAGQKIVKTNYWQHEYAKAGKLYFTSNAGAVRMLIPGTMEQIIPEIKTGKKVILPRGHWPDYGREDAFEFMFEDFSDSPYAIHVGTDQWDMIPKWDRKGGWVFAAWTENEGCVYEKRMRYRLVDKIPCMKPWGVIPWPKR